MFESIRFLARRAILRAADLVVTAPWLRWTWTGLADDSFAAALAELRPSDPEAVRDMMAGRYLLSGRLVDTGGISPFAVETDQPEWFAALHGFAWLRHFRDLRDAGERGFARTLVLDWIGHEGRFERDSWMPAVTAQRVLNWLRHLDILTDGAGSGEVRAIQRSLSTQIQSLKLRSRLSADPLERLLCAAALTGAAVCDLDPDSEADIEHRLVRLDAELAAQIDGDGMHLSRNARTQLSLLVELASIRQSLGGLKTAPSLEFAAQVERMHASLDAVTLGTGEPGYFNGCGQLAHDTLISVQAHGGERRKRAAAIVGGYAVLNDGEATVVADTGLVPPPLFAADAHASALAFEFSHGTELVVGNCGPAPAELGANRDLFRQTIAHSAPTIADESSANIAERGVFAGRLMAGAATPSVEVKAADHQMVLATDGYVPRFGLTVERRITLLAGGATLVGQDRLVANGERGLSGSLALRFHLAPGTMVRQAGEGMVRLVLANGAVWTFLWEGASLREDESVRHSTSLGFHKTRQLILEAEAIAGTEIAWIFTRETG